MTEPFKPFEIIDGDYTKGLILLCDHARNAIPSSYGTLGVPPDELKRHIAYDIGAEGVFRGLAQRLGVPGVMAGFSRLLIDPNRGEDDPTLVRQLYDGTIIAGNYPLSPQEVHNRLQQFYRPYHDAVDAVLEKAQTCGVIPAVISIHSMTDRWNGVLRPWEISVLWDVDPRMAQGLIEEFQSLNGITVGDNQPYDGALRGDTLYRHCTMNGLSHALIEFRQDQVANEEGIRIWVDRVAPIIEKLNRLPHNHERRFFGSRTES